MSNSCRFIHVPRWPEFQHDKRRKGAPWHMEYARQLDNDDYLSLSLSARGLLIGLRLMYGRRFPEGINEGTARHLLVANKSDSKHFRRNLDALNHAGFIVLSASKLLAPCAQDAALEVEVEREIENQGRNGSSYEGNGPGNELEERRLIREAATQSLKEASL